MRENIFLKVLVLLNVIPAVMFFGTVVITVPVRVAMVHHAVK